MFYRNKNYTLVYLFRVTTNKFAFLFFISFFLLKVYGKV